MTSEYYFLPQPRKLIRHSSLFNLPEKSLILLDVPNPQDVRFIAANFQSALKRQFGHSWQITASGAVPEGMISLSLSIKPSEIPQPEGYKIQITPKSISILAHQEAGLFYAVCTLTQLLSQQEHPSLPCLVIEDWPDFPVRGVMLDISRDKVPTMRTLFELVDRLASWKINQFQLYTEHTFAFQNHPEVWQHASPLTGEEILELDAFCKERFIELVPNQNCFGHMARWLKFQRYAPMAEIVGEFDVPWGKMKGPFSLAPEHPSSLPFISGLFDELLPHFTSRKFNVGCDETFDLGAGQSKTICEQRGKGRVYLDFLLNIYRQVSQRGFKMLFWGDIIKYYPELVSELPRDLIALPWGYEADYPFEEDCQQFAASGIEFYVCPGTSSWNSIAGRTDNALCNLLNAAENGLKYGSTGFLNTDWGDNGHWQVLPVSYVGFGLGAAYSWCLEANRSIQAPKVISLFAFDDPSGATGQAAFDLGNVYQAPGIIPHNSSFLFRVMQAPLERVAAFPNVQPEIFTNALQAIDQAFEPFGKVRLAGSDAKIIQREFANTVRLLRHSCRRGLLALEKDPSQAAKMRTELASDLAELVDEYKHIWLLRNRPGGMKDSVSRFDTAMADYK